MQNIFERLPDDLQLKICDMIREERHILARLLLRKKAFIMCGSYTQHLHALIDLWKAVMALKIVDKYIMHSAIIERDRHYQYCEWQLGENLLNFFTLFEELENILAVVVRQSI